MQHEKAQFKIGGISCSFCAQTIESAMKKTKGVVSASVNMAHSEALVEYDPAVINRERIKGVIESLGYIIQEPGAWALEEEERELKLEFRRAAIGIAVSLFVVLDMYLFLRRGIVLPFRRWILLGLALFVTLGLGLHVLEKAYYALKRGIFNQHVLLSFGVFGAMLGGFLGFYYPIPDFFGIAVLLMSYHLLNGWISGFVRMRSSKAVRDLLELQPPEARILRDGGEVTVPIEEVRVGDIQVVRPGENIPLDGVVVEGKSSVDQALVTGEPMPVDKEKGDEVIGGSVNKEGFLKIRVTRVGEETFLRKVARYVEESKALKPSIVLLADRILAVYVPAVLLIAAAAFLGWYFGSLLLFGEANLLKAVYAGVSVLVIGYPCALGMATPMALVRGGALAAEKGILIRSGEALQSFKDIDTMVFDKTGTITVGEPKVVDIVTFKGSDASKLLLAAASAEGPSEHVLGRSIVEHARKTGLELAEPEDFKYIPGRGIEARVKGRKVAVGSERHLQELGVELKPFRERFTELETQGKTLLLVAIDNELAGAIAISDVVKGDAKEAVSRLKDLGITPVLLTGDNERTARSVAGEVGVEEVLAQVLPDGKAERIRRLQRQGRRVAMVGDGINDAPALMQADVGIAIGAGTDIAIESSDIILIQSKLLRVVDAYHISRDTYNKTRQNLIFAFLFNGIGIPVAALGFLTPVMAMAAMLLSVALIQANSWSFKLRPSKKLKREIEGEQEELVLSIPSIHCKGCINTIRMALMEKDGVVDVSGSVKEKTIRVRYVKGKIQAFEIEGMIKGLGHALAP